MAIRIDGTNTTANPGMTGGDADTGLVFGTDEVKIVTGGTDRVTVGSTGNLSIAAGNLVLASGSGIDFSATADGSGTMTSELLDDYEEGTWTPGFLASGTVTTDVANGNYTKIGDLCFVSLVVGSTGTPVGTDSIFITGLPFAADTTTNIVRYQGSFEAIFFGVSTSEHYSLSLNSSDSLCIRETTNGGGNTNYLWQDVAAGSFELRGSLIYKVA